MKVTIERAALLKALSHLHRIVERRNTIPILSNVLIEARDGQLELKATDLDLEATEIVRRRRRRRRRHHGLGAYLPRHRAKTRRRRAGEPGDRPRHGAASAALGRSRFHLQCLPAADFPDLTTGEFAHKFELPALELRRLIENAEFAISTEETRYYLNGVFFHTAESGGATMLRAVATDGHRLARIETAAPKGATGMPASSVRARR